MAAHIRALDWSMTPLGSTEQWPQSLKAIVDLMLASPSMMSLVWGADAIHLYNDSFTELLREHRTEALGRSAFDTFARSRDVFTADVAAGMAGKSARLLAQRYPVLREGQLQDAWFDVDYAPVRDDAGKVAGVLWTLKETTAQVLAERAIRDSEARHRLMIESWAQAVWETDAQGAIVADSPSWRGYTGQTMEQWLGYGWLDAIHPDDRLHVERQWRESMAAHSVVDAEFRLRAADGGWRWTNIRAAPVFDQAGRIEKWLGMNIDIDARKQAEAALQESEEKYRTVFESIDEGVTTLKAIFDDRGKPLNYRYLDNNPAVEKIFGFEWPIGKTVLDILPDVEYHWIETICDVARTGEPARTEFSVDGLNRWVSAYFSRVGEAGSHKVVAVYDDITERKRAEQALRESEERQAFLLKLSDALRLLADAGEIQATTTRLLGMHLGVDRAMYGEVAGEPGTETGVIRGQFVRPAGPGRASPAPFPDHFTFEVFGAEVMARRYSGQGLAVADVSADPEFNAAERAAWADVGVQAAIVAPLVKGSRLVAELGVHSERPRTWTEAEISLVHEVGERTWAAAERARAEAALRESEEKYRDLFEQIDEGFCIVEMLFDGDAPVDYRFMEVNPAFERQTDIVDAPGRLMRDIAPEHEQHWFDRFGEIARTGVPQRFEAPARQLGDRWYELNAFRVGEPGQRRVAIIFNDVTQRHRDTAALRESEERQRLTIELVPALLWSTSADGREVSLNERWAAYTGQGESNSQQGGWLAAIHPDDLAEARAAFEHAFATGEPLEGEQRIRKAGDGWRWHLVRQVPVRDSSGVVTRWFGAAVDIHESKLAQQALEKTELRLQSLIDGVPQLVWRAVDGGRWTWASPQWTSYTGQAEPDSHDHGWLEPVHPDDRARVLAVWEGAIERGEFHVDYRLCYQAESRYRWFQTRATPVRDQAGQITEWLGTSTDVDDLRRLQERQQVLLAELQHRVRNILAVTRSIISRSNDGERSTEDYVQHLQGRIATLARTQVLLTRSAGKPVDLEELIRDELIAQAAEEGQISLEGEEVAISPKSAEVLTLAIHELATNATKYGAFSRPSGRLEVRWRSEPRNGQDWLVIEWRERGVAIVDAVPRRQGFGSELISRRIPYELKGHGSFTLQPGGLESRIEFPLVAGESILQTDAGAR